MFAKVESSWRPSAENSYRKIRSAEDPEEVRDSDNTLIRIELTGEMRDRRTTSSCPGSCRRSW